MPKQATQPPPADAATHVGLDLRLTAAEAADLDYWLGRLAGVIGSRVMTDTRGGPADPDAACAVVGKVRERLATGRPASA